MLFLAMKKVRIAKITPPRHLVKKSIPAKFLTPIPPPTGVREFTTSPLIAIWEILFTAYSYFTEAALRWLLLPCQ